MWKARDQVEVVFNCLLESEESFFHLFLCVMGNAADLSDFDKGQIVMARRLGTNISETARLMGCSRSTVSTYAKWMNDGETSSIDDMVLDVYTLSKKKAIGDCLAW
ncbi:uncharacterized protein TNCV_4402981 [Trichonephila clavipes]|uniref:Uncharacterized protein n=1 Tax=Trichonephila clavipes TaxID=2585209 RepID=A0A8X6SBW2_TRICX|nr:uncharacterized protein TNCV_4402981 [Trichonephila clavipes]